MISKIGLKKRSHRKTHKTMSNCSHNFIKMLRFINKAIRPARIQFRGGSKKQTLVLGIRNLSSIMPRRVSDMSLLPQMAELDDFDRGLPSLFNSPFFSRPIMDLKASLIAIDLYETEKEYHIDCDVPGFKKEEIKVEWDDSFLTIQAEHSTDKEVKEGARYIVSERSQSQMQMRRKIRLPRDAKMDEVKAKFNHGALTISVPKIENLKKEIQVSSAEED